MDNVVEVELLAELNGSGKGTKTTYAKADAERLEKAGLVKILSAKPKQG